MRFEAIHALPASMRYDCRPVIVPQIGTRNTGLGLPAKNTLTNLTGWNRSNQTLRPCSLTKGP